MALRAVSTFVHVRPVMDVLALLQPLHGAEFFLDNAPVAIRTTRLEVPYRIPFHLQAIHNARVVCNLFATRTASSVRLIQIFLSVRRLAMRTDEAPMRATRLLLTPPRIASRAAHTSVWTRAATTPRLTTTGAGLLVFTRSIRSQLPLTIRAQSPPPRMIYSTLTTQRGKIVPVSRAIRATITERLARTAPVEQRVNIGSVRNVLSLVREGQNERAAMLTSHAPRPHINISEVREVRQDRLLVLLRSVPAIHVLDIAVFPRNSPRLNTTTRLALDHRKLGSLLVDAEVALHLFVAHARVCQVSDGLAAAVRVDAVRLRDRLAFKQFDARLPHRKPRIERHDEHVKDVAILDICQGSRPASGTDDLAMTSRRVPDIPRARRRKSRLLQCGDGLVTRRW